MLHSLLGNKTSPIALDIGRDGIKMLQMRRVGATIRVGACGRWQFPPETPEDPAQRRELTVAAVRDLLRRQGFQGRRVVSALSCDQAQVKNVRIAQTPGMDLDQAVWQEAHARFNFDLAPDRLRYINAGQIRQGGEMRHEIIMFAVRPETIQAHLADLRAMKLLAEYIDMEPVALFRGFERFLQRTSDETAVSVLVDIGRGATRVVVGRGRKIIFIKSLDIGGQKLNDAVAGHLGISPAEAAELRLRIMQDHCWEAPAPAGESPTDPTGVGWSVRDGLRAEAEALAKEIGLCLRYCSVTFRGLRPERVTLMGGEAYDPVVREVLGENLGFECVLGHPLKGVDVSGVDLGSDRRATLVEWSVCAGMAARTLRAGRGAREDDHEQHRLSA